MATELSNAVELGLTLSGRLYYGKDQYTTVSSPPRPESMTAVSYLPTSIMVYAEIYDPVVVDNPDVPSYQPYVLWRHDPPALIPLHMHGVSMEVDCCLDTAFVTVSGAWRVHCVAASKSCCCRIVVPIGEEGTVLGVEVESPSNSYSTHLISLDSTENAEKISASKDGFLIKGQLYTLKIPGVYGGTVLSIKVRWSQKLLYEDGKFCLNVPFTFPSYVIPMAKKLPQKEKIIVTVNSGNGTEVSCESVHHPLEERIRQVAGKSKYSYEREVSVWSTNDFVFSYNVRPNVCSSDIVGGLLLQSPSPNDYDQREIFCFYLYPGKTISMKVFTKTVIFLVDISASMHGSPLENVKAALLAALLKLNPVDTFNIIAFNDSFISFSPSFSLATKEVIEKAFEWIEMDFIAEGGTNISAPLDQAINMISKSGDQLPIIFLITDGAVEDEKDICDAMKGHLMKGGLTSPRIFTLGIGSYCNHYFLQMLAQIGRGHYDAALDVDSVDLQMERLISRASSVILADITIDALKHLDSLEFYPSHIPDLLSECPLLISGRYYGEFQDSIEVCGTLADSSKFMINVKVQEARDIPVDRVFARRQIQTLTAQAWFSGSKRLKEKVTRLSLHTGVPSEYTSMILIETDKNKLPSESITKQEELQQKITFLRSLGTGFGNIQATAENLPTEQGESKLYETSEIILKTAANFCGRIVDRCCCMCFLRFCTRINDECAIAVEQLCTSVACFGCINFCFEVCSSDE